MKAPHHSSADNSRDPVFAYGTLAETAWQRRLFGRRLAVRPAVLPGWRRVRFKDGWLGVVPAHGARVHGMVIELNADELTAADCWEEAPRLYERRPMRIIARGGASVVCWVYVHRPTAPWGAE